MNSKQISLRKNYKIFNLVIRILGDPSELGVDDIIVASGLVTGVSLLGVGTGQGVLGEDGLVTAEEGELLSFHEVSIIVGYWHADVEYLAVTVDVSVVAVGSVLTVEAGVWFVTQDVEVTVGEEVTLGGD